MDEREDTFPMDITDPSSRLWKQSSSLGRCRHLLPALVEGGFLRRLELGGLPRGPTTVCCSAFEQALACAH